MRRSTSAFPHLRDYPQKHLPLYLNEFAFRFNNCREYDIMDRSLSGSFLRSQARSGRGFFFRLIKLLRQHVDVI
jgi:hypothetical protein